MNPFATRFSDVNGFVRPLDLHVIACSKGTDFIEARDRPKCPAFIVALWSSHVPRFDKSQDCHKMIRMVLHKGGLC